MVTKRMRLILTVPPKALFKEIIQDPIIEAVRVNTTLPIKDSLDKILSHVKTEAGNKDVWIDLKCRQLRITDYAVKFLYDGEIHYIGLNHKIKINTPTEVLIDNGNFVANVQEVINGNMLIIPSSVEKKQGLSLPKSGEIGIREGMSINFSDPSLKIRGYLTKKDKEYIKTSKKLGMHNFMLSFVEKERDILDVLALDPDAKLIAKIESKKGLEFVKKDYLKYKKKVNLMAARGDLYLEVDKPDQIIDGCNQIINYDPNSIFASRMFESFENIEKMPQSRDLFDVYCGMLMGYKRFMPGDDICSKRDSVKATIGLFDVLSKKYTKKTK